MDDRGQPVYEGFGEPPQAGRTVEESPYELNLSRYARLRGDLLMPAADAPLSVAELERILRPYDADVGALPSRLWELPSFQTGPRAAANRRIVTTDSYDLPVPNVLTTKELRDAGSPLQLPRHVTDCSQRDCRRVVFRMPTWTQKSPRCSRPT